MMGDRSFFQESMAAPASECDTRLPCGKIRRIGSEIDKINSRLDSGDEKLDLLTELVTEIKALREEIAKTKDIVEAWGNIKGFGQTMKNLSSILKVAAMIAAAVTFFCMLITHPRAAMEQVHTWIKP